PCCYLDGHAPLLGVERTPDREAVTYDRLSRPSVPLSRLPQRNIRMSTHAPARPSYAAVLRLPHARRTFASALTARLAYGTVSLAMLLSVTRSTGSYAVSGAVLSLF